MVMSMFPMVVSDVFAALDEENQASFRASREPRLGGKTIEGTRGGP